MSGALAGKVALITGAGAGIGEGIARRFADEDARVVVAELDAAAGEAVAQKVGGLFVRTDVSDRAQVESAVAAAVSEYGSLDVLVNNAWGGGSIGRVEKKTDDELAHGFAVGYYGPFWACEQPDGPHRRPVRRHRAPSRCFWPVKHRATSPATRCSSTAEATSTV